MKTQQQGYRKPHIDTANDRHARAYENYMACLKEIWTRECDDIIDTIEDLVLNSSGPVATMTRDSILHNIKAWPEEATKIITARCQVIVNHPDTVRTTFREGASLLGQMIVSIKRDRQLEELGL